jgi:GNAT superfamily N-acetyltransferase
VQPAFQRRGIGRGLLADAEQTRTRRGCATLWLTAWVGNARALRVLSPSRLSRARRTVHEFESERYENRLLARPLGPPEVLAVAR